MYIYLIIVAHFFCCGIYSYCWETCQISKYVIDIGVRDFCLYKLSANLRRNYLFNSLRFICIIIFFYIEAGAPNRGGVGGSQPPLNFGWGG